MNNFRIAMRGSYPPPFGGVSITMMQLANQLAMEQISFRVFASHKPQEQVPEYVCFYNPRSLSISKNLFLNIRKFKPDIIHSQQSQLDLPTSLIARVLGIPIIHHVHGERFPLQYEQMSSRKQLLFRIAAKAAAGIITVSEELAEFIQTLGIARSRIHVIPSLLPIAEQLITSNYVNETYGDCIIIVSSGFFPFTNPHYGFDLVPPVARQLLAKKIKYKWYLVGQASPQESKEFNHVLAKNGVQECVEFIGELDRPHMLGLLKSAHIYARTKYSDSYGLVIAEAHQLGCQCLFGDNNPYFKDGKGLIRYRTGDVNDMTSKLLELIPTVKIEKPETVESPFVAEGRENYEAIKNVYREIMGKCLK